MTCDAVRDDLAIYALGDVQPLPLATLEHVASCEACRDAYRRYLAAGERLIEASPPVAPPSRVWEGILEELYGRERFDAAASTASAPALAQRTAPEEDVGQRRRTWASWSVAAALVLAAVNAGLVFQATHLHRRLSDVVEVERATRRELTETWRAFSSAPAVYAGDIVFASNRGDDAVQLQGALYERPGGWALLLQVRGLRTDDHRQWIAWIDAGRGWREAGALLVDDDGVGSFLSYDRDALALEAVALLPAGISPDDPDGLARALAIGRRRQ